MPQNAMDMKRFEEQVTVYRDLKEKVYDELAAILKTVLLKAVKDLGLSAIVQVRAKSILSFAETAIRRQRGFPDPVNQLRDLCGARVILDQKDAIRPVCDFVERHFNLHRVEDVQGRLGVVEFGYLSKHYLVSLRKGEFEYLLHKMARERGEKFRSALNILLPGKEKAINTSFKDHFFRGEIQVRTLLQHAWAEFAHDFIYKSPFEVPGRWQRDAGRIAATLEEVDIAIARTITNLQIFRTYYGAYMDREKRKEEIGRLEIFLKYATREPERMRLAHEIARLTMSNEDFWLVEKKLEPYVSKWERSSEAESVMSIWQIIQYPARGKVPGRNEIDEAAVMLDRIRDPDMSGVLLDFGVSRWNQNHGQGRKYIEWAVALDGTNVDARIALAETYSGKKALACYEAAFRAAPGDPRALAGLIHCKVVDEHSLDFISIIAPSLETAMGICRERAKVGVYLPQAYYDIGLFSLLLGMPYESLTAYCKAAQLTDPESHDLDRAIEKVRVLQDALQGKAPEEKGVHLGWVERFLCLTKVAKVIQRVKEENDSGGAGRSNVVLNSTEIARNGLADFITPHPPGVKGPIVIVAGACDEKMEAEIRRYVPLLDTAFSGFSGTVCSGGTKAGVARLAGDLPTSKKADIRKVAYLPKTIPAWTELHKGYEVYYTEGSGFSALEPLQNWIDLLAAGIDPSDIKLLGINGGTIAALEFRLALIMGAEVGIIHGSGRAADDLLVDDEWKTNHRLLNLPNDPQTAKFFVQGVVPAKVVEAEDREKMAIKVHDEYRRGRKRENLRLDLSLANWSDLPLDLKYSNFHQVDHNEEKFLAAGFKIQKVKAGEPIPLIDFSTKEMQEKVELMAEMEHGRWNVERLQRGWSLGEKDVAKKKTSYLVPWAELPDDIKEYDREAVRALPKVLKEFGYTIVRD